MVTVLSPVGEDQGSVPGRVKPKDYKLEQKTQHLRSKAKSVWLEVMIMCPSGATCLLTGCCLCLVKVKNSAQRSGLVQNSLLHQ